MNKSEQIEEIAQALCGFQMENIEIVKNKKAHNSMYADLTQILEKTRGPLQKHGLAITQIAGTANDKVTVETVLMHKSGQWISGKLEMDIEGVRAANKAQGAGMVITYARRYGYSAILGISADDDTDAQGGEGQNRISNNNSVQKQPDPKQKINTDQVKHIYARCNNNENKIKEIKNWAGIKEINELSLGLYYQAIKILEDENKAMGGTA